ncbi:MAG: hypothetical protein KDK60_03330 [Chlamydiia bacterium]|nr:hypothetical protein [Chlamydiia bacterium]
MIGVQTWDCFREKCFSPEADLFPVISQRVAIFAQDVFINKKFGPNPSPLVRAFVSGGFGVLQGLACYFHGNGFQLGEYLSRRALSEGHEQKEVPFEDKLAQIIPKVSDETAKKISHIFLKTIFLTILSSLVVFHRKLRNPAFQSVPYLTFIGLLNVSTLSYRNFLHPKLINNQFNKIENQSIQALINGISHFTIQLVVAKGVEKIFNKPLLISWKVETIFATTQTLLYLAFLQYSPK